MHPGTRILISGAGVAGLTCALWLQQKGLCPVVVEKSDSVRTGGFLVSLSHHAYHYAEGLGIMPELRAHSCGIQSSSYHNPGGRSILHLQSRALFSGVDVIQLMRDDLVAILYRRCHQQGIELRFADEIRNLDEQRQVVNVEFASGRQESFEAVIGADGHNSAVRQLVFDADDIRFHHLNLHCAAYRLANVVDIQDKFETHMQRDRYMAVFSSGSGDLGSVFVWDCAEREVPSGDDRRTTLLAAFSHGDAATQRVIAECPGGEDIYMAALKQVEARHWCQNRIALVGDAAHSLTLFSGRGAGAAVNGASRLAAALSELNVNQAFARYESEMRPVIRAIQPATRRAVRWYVPRSPLQHLLRDSAMRLLPNVLFRAYFKMKYSNI